MVANLYNKTNALYLIAGTLAALTLLSSVVLVVASSVPPLLILTLAILSALVIGFSYKIINDRAETDRLIERLVDKMIDVVGAEKKIQELKKTIQDQEVRLSAAKKEIGDKNVEITSLKKGMETLDGITEYTQKQQIELNNKLGNAKKEKEVSENNGHKVETGQEEGQKRERSNSLPSFSLSFSLLGKKASSSTNSLPPR